MWGRRRRELAGLRRALAIETERRLDAEDDADESRKTSRHQIDRRAEVERHAQEVEAGAKRVHDHNGVLRVLLEQTRDAHHDGEYEQLEARHSVLLAAVVRYRAELAVQERRIRALQAQVDGVTGMDDPLIAAGVQWQDRRMDKQPGFDARTPSPSPSGLLPRREPGVTG